jgi:1-acyl-sn-glycerol-3-phosphate acyltransferase
MALVYSVPTWIRLSRAILRSCFRGIFHLISRVNITGLENIPPTGAYLIAINHVSLYEAPFILAFWPVAPEVAGAADVWNRRGQATLARLYGGIPVHRGHYDRRLIDTMLTVLRCGRPLLIAPEGGRSHSPGMRKAQPGIAYIVEKTAVPVVPVGIVGTTDDFLQRALHAQRPELQMRIGPALHLEPVEGIGEERRIERQDRVDMIMAHIAALLPLEYRGVYAGHDHPTAKTA